MHPRLVQDYMWEFAESIFRVLYLARPLQALAIFRGAPKRSLHSPVPLLQNSFTESERFEDLDRAALQAIGVALL